MKWARLLDGRKFEIVRMPLFINGESVFVPTNEQAEALNIKPFLDERPVETGYTFAPLDTAARTATVSFVPFHPKSETLTRAATARRAAIITAQKPTAQTLR